MKKFERFMGKLCSWIFPLFILIGSCLLPVERKFAILLLGLTVIYYTSLIVDKIFTKLKGGNEK